MTGCKEMSECDLVEGELATGCVWIQYNTKTSEIWCYTVKMHSSASIAFGLVMTSGGATPGRARSNDLAGRSTALALPCLELHIALLH